jgi:ATP-binding cassette subfamily F protein 3
MASRPAPAPGPGALLQIADLAIRFGGVTALDGVTLAVRPREIHAVIGPNGSGKTTLLETMLGHRVPDGGTVRIGHSVQPAYFSQHDVELDERGTVLECAMAMTGLARPQAQQLLGRFLFSGWSEHEKAVAVLSGGERRRLSLAVVVASGANLLVLDEPTNHLDLESREALESALEAFPGALLLVSHDRALLDAVAERTVAIEDGSLRSYDGGWADLIRARADADETPPHVTVPAGPKAKPAKERAPRRGPTELDKVESRISVLEQRIGELELTLADDWTNADVLTAHKAARDELKVLLPRWETLFESVEAP